jgi:DNA repair protein RadC
MRLRELTIRYERLTEPIDRPTIKSAQDAAGILGPILSREPCEVFGALLLNSKHKVLCWAEISRGSLASTVVLPRDVFLRAVHGNAAAILLAHNHPSGDPEASPDDRELTKRMVAAGALLGIEVLDHVIVGERSYFSFRESGLL